MISRTLRQLLGRWQICLVLCLGPLIIFPVFVQPAAEAIVIFAIAIIAALGFGRTRSSPEIAIEMGMGSIWTAEGTCRAVTYGVPDCTP
jgi:hypothetical protein